MIKFDYDSKYDILDVWLKEYNGSAVGIDKGSITEFYDINDDTMLVGAKIWNYTKNLNNPIILKLIENNKIINGIRK